jgi:hypothetical protein
MSKCYIKSGRPKTGIPGTVTMVKRYALDNVGSWEKLIRAVMKGSSCTGHYWVYNKHLFSLQ